jgi:hypothetical protein
MPQDPEVSLDERIAEMEEVSILTVAQLHNWYGADEDEARGHESRLRYLLARIQDRHNERIAARLKKAAEPPTIVTEDAEI